MAYKDEIARTIAGERAELKTLPGHWIVPRKFSTGMAGQIRALEQKIAAASPLLSAAAIRYSEKGGSSDAPGREIMQDMSPEQRQRVSLELAAAQAEYGIQLYTLTLEGGIYDHDFTDDAGVKAPVDDEFVTVILDNQAVADEMVAIIKEWNGPFGANGSRRSVTPPSGSTGESA